MMKYNDKMDDDLFSFFALYDMYLLDDEIPMIKHNNKE